MTDLLTRKHAAASDAATDDDPRSPLMRRADRWMFAGIVLAGTWVLGPIGFPLLAYAMVLMNRARKRGELTRPWPVTIIGMLCLIDACINFFAWGTDLMPSHDTGLVKTLWSGYGRMFDGAYYIDYNSTALGGTANLSEKAFEVLSVTVLFPIRIAAGWGFLRMKRWALQAMIVTSFMYVLVWVGYMTQVYLLWNGRIGASLYGVTGFWFIFLPYAGPFVMLPYLYTVDRELFSE